MGAEPAESRLPNPFEARHAGGIGGPAQGAPRERAPSSGNLGKLALFVFAFGTALLLIEAVYVFSTRHAPIPSVAVLPFTASSDGSPAEYLGDGITESIVHKLSRIPGLRVAPWSAVERFREPAIDHRTLGRLLHARAVLTGKIAQTGSTLAVTAELVDARSGAELWKEQSDRPLASLGLLAGEISQDVVGKLRLKLTADEHRQLAHRAGDNPEAYEMYLRGRYFWSEHTPDGLRKALEDFRQAAARDPGGAPAYAGLAESYDLLGEDGREEPGELFPEARRAALEALAIDPRLAEAHAALAVERARYEFDWRGAESEFQKALRLDPSDARAHEEYGLYLAGQGRLEEAMREMSRAQELDPFSPSTGAGVAEIWQWSRDYHEAIEQYQKTLALNPHAGRALGHLAEAYEAKGRYPQARAVLEKMGDTFESALSWAAYDARAGQKEEAGKLLASVVARSRSEYVPPSSIAKVYAAMGDKDQAFAWLARAYDGRDGNLALVEVDPAFDALRSDPRFAQLLERLGMPVDERRH